MEKRTLGNGNLEVSALGLGCMGLSFGSQITVQGARYPEHLQRMTRR